MVSNGDSLIRNYLVLRATVGAFGVALPVVLPLGVWVFGTSAVLQNTISDYVGTVMRGVLVGMVFSIGVFLYFYVGYDPKPGENRLLSDRVATNFAGVCAIGVALFPTNSSVDLVQVIHFVSAAALFLTLGYISLFLFTKTGGTMTDEKRKRNVVYRTSGVVILVCMALIGINALFFRDTSLADLKPVFWLEAIALWAFGWAWFVKGKGLGILADPPAKAGGP